MSILGSKFLLFLSFTCSNTIDKVHCALTVHCMLLACSGLPLECSDTGEEKLCAVSARRQAIGTILYSDMGLCWIIINLGSVKSPEVRLIVHKQDVVIIYTNT